MWNLLRKFFSRSRRYYLQLPTNSTYDQSWVYSSLLNLSVRWECNILHVNGRLSSEDKPSLSWFSSSSILTPTLDNPFASSTSCTKPVYCTGRSRKCPTCFWINTFNHHQALTSVSQWPPNRLATVRFGSCSGVLGPNLNLHIEVWFE